MCADEENGEDEGEVSEVHYVDLTCQEESDRWNDPTQ